MSGGIFGDMASIQELLEDHARMMTAIVRVIVEEANLDPDNSEAFLKMLNTANQLQHEHAAYVDLFPPKYLEKAAAGEWYDPDLDDDLLEDAHALAELFGDEEE